MRYSKEILIRKFQEARRESKVVEFKESFDPNSAGDWCEIIKDIVAIANSGGGILVFGCKSDATAVGFDASIVLKIDPAVITDKIQKYTNTSFSDFELEEVSKGRRRFAAIIVGNAQIPLVFEKPGQYAISPKQQKTAFGQGTIYFRHGAKSESCNSQDIVQVIERNLGRIRKDWLGNIKKVVAAPTDSKIEILPPEITPSLSPLATPIRFTADKNAPAYQIIDPNKTHPFRGKDVLEKLNKELKLPNKLTAFHMQSVKKEYGINETRPDFFYKPAFASPQFSETFVNWLKDNHKKDPAFFDKIRSKHLKNNTTGSR